MTMDHDDKKEYDKRTLTTITNLKTLGVRALDTPGSGCASAPSHTYYHMTVVFYHLFVIKYHSRVL